MALRIAHGPIAASMNAGYDAYAVDFPGSEKLLRNNSLIGVGNSERYCTFSAMLYMPSSNSANLNYAVAPAANLLFQTEKPGGSSVRRFVVTARNAAGTVIFSNGSAVFPEDQWCHVAVAVDMDNQVASKIIINGVNVTNWTTFSNGARIGMLPGNYATIGANYFSAPWGGAMGEVYFTNAPVDIETYYNELLRIDGTPAPHNDDGSTLHFPVPLIWMSGNGDWVTNKGTGGAFGYRPLFASQYLPIIVP